MGKSVELLGLAAFNIFIAIILSATFLTGAGSSVSALTETNVESFITEVAEVSGGKREDMDSYSITHFFMDHIAEDGVFKSEIAYAMPDMPSSTRTLEMDKLNFISHILEGMKSMTKHETAVKIEYIRITDNGKSAIVTTTNYERGVMPIADSFGDAQMVPVTGTSYCEQQVILNGKTIQMAGADCSTNIDFANSY